MTKEAKTVVTILRLKINAPKSLKRQLAEIAAQCNLARNWAIRYWQRWREDHPDWQPGTYTPTRGPNKGKPRAERKYCSHACENGMCRGLEGVVPDMAGVTRGAIASEIQEYLQAKMPYTHEGPSRFRWQAILGYEVSAPSYIGKAIPIKHGASIVCWDGLTSRDFSPGVLETVQRHGRSQAVLSVPAWSGPSGRRQRLIILFRIDGLTSGQKQILRRITRRELKMGDSKIVEKNGDWYVHLAYHQPVHDHQLDPERTAVLTMNGKDASHPFEINAEGEKPWKLGAVHLYERETQRFKARRFHLRERWRKGMRGQAGHGRGRFYERIRPASDLLRNLQERFRALLIDEVLRYCIRHNCWTLVYDSPNAGRKAHSWFAAKRLEFGWELFADRLGYKCKLDGIALASGEEVSQTPAGSRDAEPRVGSGDTLATVDGGAETRVGNSSRSRSRSERQRQKAFAAAAVGMGV